MLLLRVFAVDEPCSEAGRHRTQPQPRDRDRDLRRSATRDSNNNNNNKNSSSSSSGGSIASSEAEPGSMVWECVIDVRGLTALPAGSRLAHLWTLPADCLLVEMSNGGLYAPGSVLCFVRFRA